MFSFNPLWKLLIDRNMSKTDLRLKVGFNSATLAKMNKNEYVAMSVLDKICYTLNCNISDVIEFKKGESDI